MTTVLTETTLRNFGGGWNVSDSDKTLSSKYQPISDNVVRQTDGSFAIRPGTQLFADMKKGTVSGEISISATVMTETVNSGTVKITQNAHGLISGYHVNISSWSASVGGIPASKFIGIFGVRVLDANNFTIHVRHSPVTIATVAGVNIVYTRDTHVLGGNDIFGRYYKDNLIVFSDIGEIVAVNKDGVPTRIWSHANAGALTEPWGPCQRISAEIVRGRLIACNGRTNDKPIEIEGTTVRYLSDPSTPGTGNQFVPRADFVIAADRYVLLVAIEDDGVTLGATRVAISAKDTTSIFEGVTGVIGVGPVTIDLGMLTQSVEATILGANVIRNKVFIGFHDRSQLGDLGIFTGEPASQKHEPEFKDNVAQLGTFAHHSIISLGNDLFCCALNGINSLELSRQSGEYTPQTISDLINPALLRHLARLSEDDRRYKVFAVWDVNTRSYMLFAPKYSEATFALPDDAITVTTTLQPYRLAFINFPSHIVDAGDFIDISGVLTDPDGFVPASSINGRRRIRSIVNDDTIVIECGPYDPKKNITFGGQNINVSPVIDETPAYVYEYNVRLKIRRWTRFRGLNFNWGCVSQLNKLFFGKNGRIYRMGNASDKYTADKIGDYTQLAWANNTAYSKGDRILDASVRDVFVCMQNHTSAMFGTFAQTRADPANREVWEKFKGFPIRWELETAWTDFKERKMNKQIELVSFDTEGASEFEFSMYTDSIRQDFESYLLTPNRSTIFVGQDAPGYGAGEQSYGGGRNTRQEWLHGMPVYGKLFRLRFAGASTKALQVNAVTMYYHKSGSLT